MDRFFEEARRQFPNAKLVVNEFGVEAVHSQEREKRDYLLNWLEGAVARGCPIDGVGLQSHLSVRNSYDEAAMAAFARRVTELGLAIFITELDVSTRGLPDSTGTAERDRIAGDLAAQHVRTMLENGDLKEITWWGLSSRASFLAKRGAEEALEPTLFDANLYPMPMYDAVCQVLEAAA
jgi:endo-1,4-beta-xylanase